MGLAELSGPIGGRMPPCSSLSRTLRAALCAVAYGHPRQRLRATACWQPVGTGGWPFLIELKDAGLVCGLERVRSRLLGAPSSGALLGALLGLLETVGLALDGDDLGVVDQAVDQ